mmetsp:Transcript_24996/g.43867  ORF Transcript_24996/g.43867 Transcript_24996/m.43867 type:complete len:88 (+) Transcript_24996:1480-1743(+)
MAENFSGFAQKQRWKQLANIYGSHLPAQLIIERNLAAQHQRLGLPSSFLSLEVLTGAIDDLPFPAYLEESPDFGSFNPAKAHQLHLE